MKNSCKLYLYNMLSRCYGKTLLLTMLIISGLWGGVKATSPNYQFVFSEKIYFSPSSASIEPDFNGNHFRIENIRRFLSETDSLHRFKIEIIGSASPEGNQSYNQTLARKRASALSDYFKIQYCKEPKTVVSKTLLKSAWPDDRYAELRVSYSPPENSTHNNGINRAIISDNHEQTETPLPRDSIIYSSHSHEPARVSDESSSKITHDHAIAYRQQPIRLTIGSNMLYDAALIPNIGIGICLNEKYTIWADWMYAWWSNRDRRRYWRVYGGDIEVRMQLGHGLANNPFSGHRIGLYASIVTYDIQTGRSHTGIIGDKFNYAAGISYGYTLPLTRRLNLDFSIGIGYLWGKYMKQHLVDTHDVWISTHNRRWIGPTKAEIGLSWLIGTDNTNIKEKKGGGE